MHRKDKSGQGIFRKKCSRQQMMTSLRQSTGLYRGYGACAGAHFVARELMIMGHQAKLISPQFVRPFVKGSKNNFVDADAICEAASLPPMRFVSHKTEAQQTLPVWHRLRESLVRDRTKTANQIHGFLLEFGISLPRWKAIMKHLFSVLAKYEFPVRLTVLLQQLHEHFVYLDRQIKELDEELANDDLGSRLLSLPCVGPITLSLLAVGMGDASSMDAISTSPRLLAWCPLQYSTGGKANLLGISKHGDKNLKRQLVQCTWVYMQRLEHQKGALADWVRSLLMRLRYNVVDYALANKLARIAWTIAPHHSEFEAGPNTLSA